MDFDAFAWIQNGLYEELQKQGFGEPRPMEDEKGRAVLFPMEEAAYSLLFDEEGKKFQLRSASLDEDGNPGDWKSLSLWLFDPEEGTRSDAESILNDFLEVVQGPKRTALVQQKKKRGKDDERTVDPMFFLNRLANIFPEVKEELKQERITYGQVRFVTFTKEHVVPVCQEAVEKHPGSGTVKKLCDLLTSMYKVGDLDTRAIVTASLLNSMSDGAFATLRDGVGEELQKDLKYTRKLKDKKIKPEKQKKRKKVEARLQA